MRISCGHEQERKWSNGTETYEGVQESDGSVNTIEHRNDQCRVVDFEAAIETDDLRNGCNSQKDKSEDRGSVSKLVASIFLRQTARNEFHTV